MHIAWNASRCAAMMLVPGTQIATLFGWLNVETPQSVVSSFNAPIGIDETLWWPCAIRVAPNVDWRPSLIAYPWDRTTEFLAELQITQGDRQIQCTARHHSIAIEPAQGEQPERLWLTYK